MKTLSDLIRSNTVQAEHINERVAQIARAVHAVTNQVYFSDSKDWYHIGKDIQALYIQNVRIILEKPDPRKALYEIMKSKTEAYHQESGNDSYCFPDYEVWLKQEEGYYVQLQIDLVTSLSTGLLNPYNYTPLP
jgi:hypothetical protein